MKTIMKIEMERAFKGIGIKIALLIGMGLSIANLILHVIPRANNPLVFFDVNYQIFPYSVFNSWMGANSNYQYQLFIRLIPILVVLPYGISYFTDMKTGIVKNYYSRMKKSNYIIAKYCAVFASGGLVIVIPLIFNLLVTSAILPSLVSANGTYSINANGMWSSIFYTNPYLYITMYLILNFIIAGFLGCIALTISQFVNNRFVAMLFPFLLCEFTNAITRYSSINIIKGIAPYRIFSISQLGFNYKESAIIVIVILFIVGYGLFYFRGVKDDTL